MSRPKKKPQPEQESATAELKPKTLTTRMPVQFKAHLASVAKRAYGYEQDMYEIAVADFIEKKPWERGLAWRLTKGDTTRDRNSPKGSSPTGWVQVNLLLKPETREEVYRLVGNPVTKRPGILKYRRGDGEGEGKDLTGQPVTRSAFLYTALYWWGLYVWPPSELSAWWMTDGLPDAVEPTRPLPAST